MPPVSAPKPPLARTPTFRFGGKTAEVVLADGRVVPPKEVAQIARWTSLRLLVVVERYPFEWAQDREPRVPAARALAVELGKAASWKRAHVDMGRGHGSTPSQATPVAKGELEAFAKKVVLQRFNANQPAPSMLLRTGAELDVQYEWSYRVTDVMLELFAHDTPANRAKMEKLFDRVRRAHAGAAWATLGHAYAGAASTTLAGVSYPWGVVRTFYKHEQKQLAPPWRAHIGRLWLDVPETGAKAAAFAKAKPAIARVDDHGLEITATAPKSATDRAATTPAARAFATIKKALGKMVTAAFHDARRRRELLGPGARRPR